MVAIDCRGYREELVYLCGVGVHVCSYPMEVCQCLLDIARHCDPIEFYMEEGLLHLAEEAVSSWEGEGHGEDLA